MIIGKQRSVKTDYSVRGENNMLGKILLGLLIAVVILGAIGWWMKKRNPGEESGEETLDKAMGNVVDLNDRFNRARQMDQNGK